MALIQVNFHCPVLFVMSEWALLLWCAVIQKLVHGIYTAGNNYLRVLLNKLAVGVWGGLDTPTACIQAQATGQLIVVMTWRGIRSLSDGAANATSDSAVFIKSCGSANKRRRVYSINTVII